VPTLLPDAPKARSARADTTGAVFCYFHYFCTVKYENDWETIYWNNGVDFCADVLYGLAVKTNQKMR